jgi:hypothetical protein
LKFSAVDQELFNQVIENLISALDKFASTEGVSKKD